jgi:predicted nucleotidyltransferase
LAAVARAGAGETASLRMGGVGRMETRLKEIVERLKAAAGSNLSSVVLYGSAVTGEFTAKHSDLNIVCVVEQAGAREIEQLHPAAEWWVRKGNSPPVIFTMEELRRSADVFAIELLDMKQNHRVLLGPDFLENFEVPLKLHRLQVERELRTSWLRLRQTVLLAPAKQKARLDIMLASFSAFCALFRHALIALGQPAPATKREAVEAIALLTGANPSAFVSILDLRAGKRRQKQIAVNSELQMYLEFVEVVTNQVCSRVA